jgi:hypothetical protein
VATFQHSLNASLREIRLLVLHPASVDLRGSTLEMSLIKTRLGGPLRVALLVLPLNGTTYHCFETARVSLPPVSPGGDGIA